MFILVSVLTAYERNLQDLGFNVFINLASLN